MFKLFSKKPVLPTIVKLRGQSDYQVGLELQKFFEPPNSFGINGESDNVVALKKLHKPYTGSQGAYNIILAEKVVDSGYPVFFTLDEYPRIKIAIFDSTQKIVVPEYVQDQYSKVLFWIVFNGSWTAHLDANSKSPTLLMNTTIMD